MLTLHNDYFTVTINELGAEVTQITRQTDGRNYLLVDPEGHYWNRHAPILFPAIGKSNADRYTLDGQTYPMSQHGFARDGAFTVVGETTPTQITLKQTATAETLVKFPFAYSLSVTYTLTATGLTTDFTVANHDQKLMPYALGSHPAFQLYAPLSDYHLELADADEPVQAYGIGPVPFRDGTLTPFAAAQGTQIPLNHALLDSGLIIFDAPHTTAATLAANDGSHRVSVSLQDFPYVTIWSAEHKNAPFLCVEPFAGLPDQAGAPSDWRQKAGNNLLEPAATQHFGYTMTLD
ncbi:MAG: aldose 1-epimerase family protein [Lactobacillus sp.]|jgi:galactose mutarotase-like enzyme|nr:aldose 1-epimerase family protein [Lactobacillus sp.]MCI2033255.1 aldose 1-epimerase family protein [Lactobacillus sp.]